MELDGAVAIVTGAARGIGKAIAAALAARGARVALVDRLAEPLRVTADEIERAGGRVLPLPADVTVDAEVQALVARVQRDLGFVNVLVNNAGVQSAIGPVWETDPRKWLQDVTVNLYGTFLCCRAVAGGMIERRRGCILNMAGAGAHRPFPHISGYVASKAAVTRFTESLADELREVGVKVFALHPGAVRTGITEHMMTSPEGRTWCPGFPESFAKSEAPVSRVVRLALELIGGRADRLSGRYFDAAWDFDQIVARTEAILSGDDMLLRLQSRYG